MPWQYWAWGHGMLVDGVGVRGRPPYLLGSGSYDKEKRQARQKRGFGFGFGCGPRSQTLRLIFIPTCGTSCWQVACNISTIMLNHDVIALYVPHICVWEAHVLYLLCALSAHQ